MDVTIALIILLTHTKGNNIQGPAEGNNIQTLMNGDNSSTLNLIVVLVNAVCVPISSTECYESLV